VGLLKSTTDIIGFDVASGHIALVLGETKGHLGQSALLAEAFNRTEGDAPHVDLTAEAAHGNFIRTHHALIAACTDLSDGGLALAGFEMSDHAGLGLALDTDNTAQLFGEDQARYLIAATPENAVKLQTVAQAAGIPLSQAGTFGGDTLSFGTSSAELSDLGTLYRASFAATVT
jgi:phosphoribosylformylglycinamidine synthase